MGLQATATAHNRRSSPWNIGAVFVGFGMVFNYGDLIISCQKLMDVSFFHNTSWGQMFLVFYCVNSRGQNPFVIFY